MACSGCCGGLASLGIFEETAPRQFALTPLAELLRSDHPHSMRMLGRLMGDEHSLGWADLLHSVRTGEGAFRHRYGMSVFEWYQQNPRRGAIFDAAMGDHSRAQIDALLAAYDFSGISHLVDVGGGRGLLLQKVLAAYPALRGTGFDQPQVVAPVAVPPELAVRLSIQGGDFSPPCPPAPLPTCPSTSSTTGAMRPACGSWARSAPSWPPAPGCCWWSR